MPCQVEEGRCSSGGGLDHTGWCACQVEEGRCSSGEGWGHTGWCVTHAMSGGGEEVQQWWRVGPHGVMSHVVLLPCQMEEA